MQKRSSVMACARLVEGAEATEDVDGMSERGGVSSCSPTEKIRLQRVPTTRGKEATARGEVGCSAMGVLMVR